MNDKPSLERIEQLIEIDLIFAMKGLDDLSRYHAQHGEINDMVAVLEELNLKYPHCEAINWRLRTVNHKLGRNNSDAEVMPEA